jgi:hypothetical protein
MCGIQFPKHAKFADHMKVEHDKVVTTEKSPLEEEDISSNELRYMASRDIGEPSGLQDEEIDQVDSSSMLSSYFYQDFGKETVEESNKILIKSEKEKPHPMLEETMVKQFLEHDREQPEAFSYQDFKEKFMKNIDSLTFECKPCKRVIIKTSVCAHLRLWHATKMMFNCELCSVGFRRHDYRQRHMASVHPHDFFCNKCNQQFYRSSTYVDHMQNSHKISLEIPELKSKDEVDVPLENLSFATNVPDSERTHPEESIRTKRRLSVVCDDSPINPKAGGLTYRDFCNEYIREEGNLMRCLPCNKTFSKLSIKKHLKKLHATSRPYNCELCENNFFRMDERLAHMKVMHKNSLNCSLCDTQFYMSILYIEHMKSRHGKNVKALSDKGKTDVDVPIERLRFIADNGHQQRSPVASSATAVTRKKVK